LLAAFPLLSSFYLCLFFFLVVSIFLPAFSLHCVPARPSLHNLPTIFSSCLLQISFFTSRILSLFHYISTAFHFISPMFLCFSQYCMYNTTSRVFFLYCIPFLFCLSSTRLVSVLPIHPHCTFLYLSLRVFIYQLSSNYSVVSYGTPPPPAYILHSLNEKCGRACWVSTAGSAILFSYLKPKLFSPCGEAHDIILLSI
jgi:hypothetical protein